MLPRRSARAPRQAIKACIDDPRVEYGAEPIGQVRPIAPSTDDEHAARKADPERRSAHAPRDARLGGQTRRVWAENVQVYGVRKVWRQRRREACAVARGTVWRG